MDVVVDGSEHCLGLVEIAQFGTDRPAVENRSVALLDRIDAGFEPIEERADVQAGAVEIFLVPERHVEPAEHRRTADQVDLCVWQWLIGEQRTVETAEHAVTGAGLPAEPPEHVPVLDLGFCEQGRNPGAIVRIDIEPVFLGAGKSQFAPCLIVGPGRHQIDAGEHFVLVDLMGIRIIGRIRRQGGIPDGAKAVVANIEFRYAAR